MATFQEHCEDCIRTIGSPFPHVHKWLDEHFGQDGYPGNKHRRIRHHKEGVEEARAQWGELAAKAAEIHIKADMGTVKTRNEVSKIYPVSKKDLLAIGDYNVF